MADAEEKAKAEKLAAAKKRVSLLHRDVGELAPDTVARCADKYDL
jgi:hypothetical protein